jgi:hypothetical protein
VGWKAARDKGCHETRAVDTNIADGEDANERRRATDIDDTYLRDVHQRSSHEGGDGDSKSLRADLHGRLGRSFQLLHDAQPKDLDRGVHSGSETRFVWRKLDAAVEGSKKGGARSRIRVQRATNQIDGEIGRADFVYVSRIPYASRNFSHVGIELGFLRASFLSSYLSVWSNTALYDRRTVRLPDWLEHIRESRWTFSGLVRLIRFGPFLRLYDGGTVRLPDWSRRLRLD